MWILIFNIIFICFIVSILTDLLFGKNKLSRFIKVILVPVVAIFYFWFMAEMDSIAGEPPIKGYLGEELYLILLVGPIILLIIAAIIRYIIGDSKAANSKNKVVNSINSNQAILNKTAYTQANNNSSPVVENKVIFTGGANYIKGKTGLGGTLHLTSNDLIFKAHNFNKEVIEIVIPLDQIVEVKANSNMGFVPNGLHIVTKNGNIQKFVVFKRNIWIEQLNKTLTIIN